MTLECEILAYFGLSKFVEKYPSSKKSLCCSLSQKLIDYYNLHEINNSTNNSKIPLVQFKSRYKIFKRVSISIKIISEYFPILGGHLPSPPFPHSLCVKFPLCMQFQNSLKNFAIMGNFLFDLFLEALKKNSNNITRIIWILEQRTYFSSNHIIKAYDDFTRIEVFLFFKKKANISQVHKHTRYTKDESRFKKTSNP